MSERRLLYFTATLRALATGMLGVLLGLYLARLGFPPTAIGAVVAAGLAGAALATLAATLFADRLGRRRFLVRLSLASALGACAALFAQDVAGMALAAFVGMLNGMGRDRGAALVVEQAILPATASDTQRTRAFAWYHVLQDLGHAGGGLLAAAPVLLRGLGMDEIASFRMALGFHALASLAAAACYLRLRASAEPVRGAQAGAARLAPSSRATLWKISSLFALDSLAGGFLNTALLSYFFFARFGVDEAVIGLLFFAARLLNAGSHLAAAWLAARIGLVNTMVFTHLPSSLLLMSVPFAPSFGVAAALFLLREGLVEMDVPTRQSYVMAVMRPEERTLASGVTHLVRLAGWALGPAFAGAAMQALALGSPLVVGAAMKIAYDLLLYRAFKGLPPPEERRAAAG